ncbi:MAG: prepilin peptidase [Erysipelotrichaceae bacterium]|nr:prepilin peptidase [Erysipelotrichaceae bacterium]
MFYLIIGLIGMCLASFVNVVVYRFPKNEDFIFGHSYCPNCHHYLSFLDMIPVISYLSLKGRCRYCHHPIPIRDTFIEIFGGIVAVLCFHVYGKSTMFFIALLLAFVFLTISLLDYDTMIIDDRFQIILLAIAFISMFFNNIFIYERIIGCIVTVLPLYLLNHFKECIGGADLKIMAIMGWMLGFYYSYVGLFIAIMLASLYALIKLLCRKVTIKTYIPFAPFLCIGYFMSLLYGCELLNMYTFWL